MLRHPFFGIVEPEATAIARRTFFGQVTALAAGAAAILLGRTSRAQPLPGSAGVRSGVTIQPAPSGERYTTQTLGEEGSAYPPGLPSPPGSPGQPPPGVVTTYAVGEE